MHPTTTHDTKIESIAKVLIVDNQNRALVLILGEHKTNPKRSFTPDLPGGIVDPGESERDAAIRETKEEAGFDLNAQNIQLAYAQTAYYESEKKTVSKLLYIARIDAEPEVTLSWEHSSYEWVPLDKLLVSTEFRPFFQEAIEYSLTNGLL
jgi:8-oxo-dGTP diphosphatase